MMHATQGSQLIRRFSTTALADGDRVPYWSDFFASVIVHCDVEVEPGSPFHADAELLVWPELHALWSKEAPMRYTRSHARTGDGDDSLVLVVRRSGVSTVSQQGVELSAGPGEAIAFLGGEPTIATVTEIDALNLSVPRTALEPLVGDVASKTLKLIPSECQALRLLTCYADILRDGLLPATAEMRNLITTHIQDLIATALGATTDGAAVAEGRGVRAARMRAVKSDIIANIGSPALTVRAVALRQQVTPRYIHMLFEGEGQTFSEFVLAQRLKRAYRLLRDKRFKSMRVSSIAFAAGFGDLSYFNRTFRRRFGATPSEIR